MNVKPDAPTEPNLAERLRDVHVGVRRELEVSRHLFRGKPTYIIRDPITFQTHHLTPSDYEILIHINKNRTLGEVFQELVAAGTLDAAEEEPFYGFVLGLHKLAFLNLPVSDEKAIYRRFESKQLARKRELLMGFLFLRIPLFNPDSLLEKTIGRAGFIFHKRFFIGWVLAMALCAFVVTTRWHELVEPLNGLLASKNLVLLWSLFVGLKVLHEFGHAYACKHFGGYVPEMGAYMIAFTPCAYVDASAAWGFVRKRDRLIVSLAGMYIESIAAAVGLLVWSMTGPSLVNSMAYQTFFLAGFVTIAFNINPLMRYDGYYIFSDMLELPNLRSRADKYVRAALKRITLGIKPPALGDSPSVRATLFIYGVAATIYRAFLILAICGLIASKMFLLGMVLATVYAGKILFKTIKDSVGYLWLAQETAPVRLRAKAISVMLMIGLPIGIAVVPLPVKITAHGIVTTEIEHVVRAGTDGFVDRILVEQGQPVSVGDALIEIRNLEQISAVAEAKAQVETAKLRIQSSPSEDPARMSQEIKLLGFYQQELEFQESELMKLRVVADQSGVLSQCLRPNDTHRFMQAGEPIATINAGPWRVRTLVTAEEFSDIEPAVGQPVQCRVPASPSTIIHGTIIKVSPAGSRHIGIAPLTHLAGGWIPVNPQSNESNQPYFEITIAFTGKDHGLVRTGTTVYTRFDTAMQPIGIRLYRRLLRFKDRLLTG